MAEYENTLALEGLRRNEDSNGWLVDLGSLETTQLIVHAMSDALHCDLRLVDGFPTSNQKICPQR